MKLPVILACTLVVMGCGKQEQVQPRVALRAEVKAPDGVPWIKVGARDFDAKVLRSNLPALVYFDTAVGCRTVDDAFLRLRRERVGRLNLYYVDADKYPELSGKYGVNEEVMLVLFRDGRLIRSIEAKDVNGSIQKRVGFHSIEQINAAWFDEVERFVDGAE